MTVELLFLKKVFICKTTRFACSYKSTYRLKRIRSLEMVAVILVVHSIPLIF
jgi:hypothetical protein